MSLSDKIIKANQRIKSKSAGIRLTPLEKSADFSERLGCDVYLKCEHLQYTGSFKFRGALNKVLLLSDRQRSQGIVAASTGNHGLGVALAAQRGNTSATVYVPENVSPMKLHAIEALGASIVKTEGVNALYAEQIAREKAEKQGKVFISPYNDIDVIAGQGTIGVELLDQCANLDAIFIAVGGGGLLSGIGTMVKSVKPKVEIIGCWPENAPAMYDSLNAGCIVMDSIEKPTLSDGTAGGLEAGAITFGLCQRVIDNKVLISEEEIIEAMKQLGQYERWIVEGAAGVAMAGLIKCAPRYQNKKVAVVVCGRNIAFDYYLGLLKSPVSSSRTSIRDP